MRRDLIRFRRPIFLAMLLFLCRIGFGEIIPSDRRITWANNVGIPGGIPNRTTIFTNLTGIDATGVNNVQPAIQAAINACPAGQVVYLPAGTYRVDSHLLISKSITLRGAGMNNTIIKGTVAGGYDGIVMFQSAVLNGQSSSANITAGATKGSTNLTLAASDSNLRTGYIIYVDQLDNETFIDGSGVGGPRADNDDRGSSGGGTHHNSQAVEVQAINGNNLTVWPPLVWTFANSPQIYYKRSSSATNNYLTWAGVEDLCLRYVNPNSGGGQNNLMFSRSAYCWAKNVKTTDAYTAHLQTWYGFRIEIRGCTFSNSVYPLSGSGGYGLLLEYQTCSSLVEDNIFIRNRDFIKVDAGSSGNVIIYNYHTNALPVAGTPNWTVHTGGAHSAHPMMNLFEGNITYTPVCDFYWGSGSHQTFARNWFRGPMPYASQMGSALVIGEKQTYYNVVGNVLGSTFQKTNPKFPTKYSVRINPQSFSYSGAYATFLIGYYDENTTDSYDAHTQWANTIAAGNYDYISGSQDWYNPTSPETIPASYYYANKPAYFGNLAWPPIDSAIPTIGETVIPAGYRNRYGTNPPAGPVNNQPPVVVAGATPQSGVAPQTVAFSSAGSYDPEGAILSYNWIFGDGTSSTTANPSHAYQKAGTYAAQLTVSDGTNTTPSSVLTMTVRLAPPTGVRVVGP